MRPPELAEDDVEFRSASSDQGSEQDLHLDSEDVSPRSIVDRTFSVPPQETPVKGKNRWQRHFLINLKYENNSSGVPEVSALRENTETFEVSKSLLVGRQEMMHMIQEGIRMTLGKRTFSNKKQITKQVARDTPIKYSFSEYHPNNFYLLRKLAGWSSEEVVKELCDRDLSGGFTNDAGKSGSLFWNSMNNRLILKSVDQTEAAALVRLCGSYRRYLVDHPNSLLVRFMGLFKIIVGNSELFLTLMGNVLDSPAPLDSVYDLKGTTESRFVEEGKTRKVLKDLNFIGRAVTLPSKSANALLKQLEQDSLFLKKHDIMDYSMLLGVRRIKIGEEIPVCTALLNDRLDSVSEPSSPSQSPQSASRKAAAILRDVEQKIKKQMGKIKRAFNRKADNTTNVNVAVTSKFKECFGGVAGVLLNEVSESASAVSSIKPGYQRPQTLPLSLPIASRGEAVDGAMGEAAPASSFLTGDSINQQYDACIYYVGIIDILTTYNLKKKAAHFIKKCTIGCCHEIDTEPPMIYQPRFNKYFASKIVGVPRAVVCSVVQTACISKIQKWWRISRIRKLRVPSID